MKRLVVCIAVLAVIAPAAFATPQSEQPTVELTCGSVDAVGTIGDRTVNYMVDWLKEKSGGKIIVKSFPANQLGQPPDMIEQCSVGALDIVWADISNYGPIHKDYNIFGMGYAFRDQEHLKKFLESSEYKRMTEELRQAKGIVTLASGSHRPARDVFSKKPINSAEDFVGMKFRVPGLEMYLKTFEAMGTLPVRIAYAEAYMALSQGLADGLENSLDAGYGMKFHQVAKYIVPTGHIRTVTTFVMNEKKLNSLPASYQKLIREAALAMDEHYVGLLKTELDTIYANLKAEGAVLMPPIDVKPLQAKLLPAVREIEEKGTWSKGLWDRIQAIR